MNNPAVENALDFGHMTEEERRRILLDAKEQRLRIQEERLQEAERRGLAEGERKGLVEGERRGLLDATRMTLTLSLPADEVNPALESLERLNSIEQIRAAIAELVNRAPRR
jgi:flagellar biosynthesis/type III secretory pathway protein FliH